MGLSISPLMDREHKGGMTRSQVTNRVPLTALHACTAADVDSRAVHTISFAILITVCGVGYNNKVC